MREFILLIFLMLSVQMSSQVIIEYTNGEAETTTGVGSYTLNVYSESKGSSILNNSQKIADIPKGERFYILEDLGDEYLISYNEQVGYVLASSVKIEKQSIQDKGLENKEYGYVKRSLNLYKESVGYGFDNVSKRLKRLSKGDKVFILEEVGKEYKVSYNDQIGYLEISGIEDGKEYDEEQKRILRESEQEKESVRQKTREAIETARKEKEEREERILKKYGNYNGKRILEGVIAIGMTKEMVRDSWGKPSDINTTTYSWGTTEQWVYGIGKYVYFENDKVNAIQN